MQKAVFSLFVFALIAVLAYVLINEQIPMGNLILKSSAFKEGDLIPPRFTCDGDNINPLLEIRNIPENTKSLVLIVDDPDATGGRTFDHWLVFNMPAKTQYISEDSLPLGAKEGINGAGSVKYVGPCPPRGNAPHRYMFKLYALDAVLDLVSGVTKAELEKTMAGHILDQTVLIGRYGRH
ncbi:MAG: Phospholipid-binding protein, PBP family [Candidatus Jorgensenbacteria bacterium GW2011_GWA1_48_11]|uniref:Phospholipid-binding protein, PBP family n=1 Tax=Candidatus Jorgensenbacteria bacterium GW2011_GWA1_48_11 TaxID=1618660 RepID=A0A0G1UAT8_9BACT|nr:MAG: Phospholipid-binding protein, PBP family [Candidatus Jorgensenbacteria bacterium GW2011_GWA1_48_11]KKW12729.1 MAG: Phospholipid-binding protein, PBP family [Candidatus Jorgensenbacteria bacterium GW2011_GWB1_49_9]